MWETFIHKLQFVISDKSLRGRILFILGGLVLFTILRAVPAPGVDSARLADLFQQEEFLGFIDIFAGGGLSSFSIVMLGVGPFITSSIIMQLMTVVSPKLKSMYQEEGEVGKRKFTQYSRMITVPIAAIQSFGFMMLLQQQNVLLPLEPFELMTNVAVITAASILLMWIGELISEYGIGNGISLLIFAGIVASVPGIVSERIFSFTPDQLPMYIAFLAFSFVVILGVVTITEAERPVPVTYAKQSRGQSLRGGAGVSTYLPLRLNQGGVIPIIFGLSILLFPQTILEVLTRTGSPDLAAVAGTVLNLFTNEWIYGAAYFILVFGFTYFYVAITFDPSSVSKNLQKSGAFIPGVRPGEATSTHIGNILTRLTLVGASFLGLIAVLPLIMQAATGFTTLAIGGTALLITVVVVTDLIKKIDAQIALREY